jgi:hypothetical protein
MRCRFVLASFQTLSVATAAALLAGCAGVSAVTPKPKVPQAVVHSILNDTCPAKGPIEYVSDDAEYVGVFVYAGNFAGQASCFHITAGLHGAQGLYVQPVTHDLYVANTGNQNIQVFHRGETVPYNTYPIRYHSVTDVTVANDGTVIAIHGAGISTWVGGPHGGTFVGTFPLKDHPQADWVTAQGNGSIYYDFLNPTTHRGELWTLECPAGHCHRGTQVAGVTLQYPEGMEFDSKGDLLVVSRDVNQINNTLNTYELPNPSPSTLPLLPGWPTGVAISETDHHLFVVDAINHDAVEYSYPNGQLIGTVQDNSGGYPIGVAVDN